jgi:hypothetical protein
MRRVPPPGDIVIINDGGQKHLYKDLLLPFSEKVNKSVAVPGFLKNVTMMVSEESITARKVRKRGEPKQVHNLLHVTPKNMTDCVPDMPHKHYPGTSRGEAIAWVNLTPLHDVWELKVEQKRGLYGAKMIATGAVDRDPRSARPPESLEPAFYSFLPEVLYQDLLHTYCTAGVLDLTTGPGEAAKACLGFRKPYCGIVMTDQHADLVFKHLVAWVQKCMAQEGHTLYNQKYAEAQNAKASATTDDGSKPTATLPASPKAKSKAQAAKAKVDDSDSDSGESKKKKNKKNIKKKQGKKQKKKASSSSDSQS